VYESYFYALGKNVTQIKCRGDCTCSSPENCLQNAIAYNAVAKYVRWCQLNKKEAFVLESLEKLAKAPTNHCHSSKQDKCASVGAHHKVVNNIFRLLITFYVG
jgi:hypothetical protein